jgi:hypothetical protein
MAESNPYDKASRRVASQMDSAGFLSWLLGANSGLVFEGWLDTRTTPLPKEADQIGDLVAALTEAGVGPWWAIPVEFQAEPDSTMFGRALAMMSRVWLDLRPPGGRGDRYQLGFLVVNLTGRGKAAREMTAAAGRLHLSFRPIECNLAEFDASDNLERIAKGELSRCVLPWIPLLRGGCEAKTIQRWLEIASSETNVIQRAEYGYYARTFAELVDKQEVWKSALEGWSMIESPFFQEIRAAGQAAGQADALLVLLEARFPKQIAEDIIQLIRKTTDANMLSRWIRSAATAQTLLEFRKLIGA